MTKQQSGDCRNAKAFALWMYQGAALTVAEPKAMTLSCNLRCKLHRDMCLALSMSA